MTDIDDGIIELYAQMAEDGARAIGLSPNIVDTIGYYQRANRQATMLEFQQLMDGVGRQKLQLAEGSNGPFPIESPPPDADPSSRSEHHP